MDTWRCRRAMRLRGYDYTQPGAYFVTVCAQDRRCVFGDVVDGIFRPTDAGQMVAAVWRDLPAFYPGVDIDAFAVMPNHVHGIVVLVGAAPRGRPCPGQAQGPAPTVMSLPEVVKRFKTMTTKRYSDGVRTLGWLPFRGRPWQRNYYERIVRDEAELNLIRQYVAENPARWDVDIENPGVAWPTRR